MSVGAENYLVVNLRSYLDEENAVFIGEDALKELLSEFSCPPNADTERFLHRNAVEFTRKSQSVTYLVFRAHDGALAGYFTLAVKPITVARSSLSKTQSRRLERVAALDEETQTYTAAAYLIAQLAKNYALPAGERIPGDELLALASQTIEHIRDLLGGVIEFLECEDKEFLMEFYSKNGFRFFSSRLATVGETQPHVLNQLLRFI